MRLSGFLGLSKLLNSREADSVPTSDSKGWMLAVHNDASSSGHLHETPFGISIQKILAKLIAVNSCVISNCESLKTERCHQGRGSGLFVTPGVFLS